MSRPCARVASRSSAPRTGRSPKANRVQAGCWNRSNWCRRSRPRAARMSREEALAGVKVVIDAGPTYEDIDPVRFLGNRSSGKMGFAVAEAAAQAGADVTLIAGPVALATPPGVRRRVDVRSALQMRDAVMHAIEDANIFIATAAVADWRVADYSARKIKKGASGTPVLELVENPDILAEVAARNPRPFVVGFAAETDHVLEHARAKLVRK